MDKWKPGTPSYILAIDATIQSMKWGAIAGIIVIILFAVWALLQNATLF